MSFARLLGTVRGQILLINLGHTVTQGLVHADKLNRLLPALRRVLQKLPPDFADEALIKAVGEVIWDDGQGYQLAATDAPAETLRIAAIRTLDELRPLLQRIRRVHGDPDLHVESALAPEAPEDALVRAAELLNHHAREMPQLTVGRAFNFFWATTADEVSQVAARLGTERKAALATALRDRLGLVHLRPVGASAPIHLFAFEADAPLASLEPRSAFRVSRPTTLDGFDNPRFRQLRPEPDEPSGWGATVDLTDGAYGVGAPEIVSTEIPMQNQIRCRYVGRVLSDPAGTDQDFLQYLCAGLDLKALAADLDDRAAA